MGEIDLGNVVRPTIVEVWAPSCSECRAMEHDLETVAAEFAGRVTLEKIDASRETATADALGVMATPTLVGLAGDGGVFRYTGRRSRSELVELFTSLASGDVAVGVGRQDAMLRLGAGIALLGVGWLTGPAWPLVAAGAAASGWGLVTWRQVKA